MSYLISRPSTIEFALLSCQSAGSGNVTFSYVNGDFLPTISTTIVTLEAGYEYSIFTALATSATGTINYNHIFDGVSGTSYSIGVVAQGSGLDQLLDQVNAPSDISFSINATGAITTNSRIEIWRTPL
jgi:hypothetical protein